MASQPQVPWNSSRGGKKFKIGESTSHPSLRSPSVSTTSPQLPLSTSAQQNMPVPSQGSASTSQPSQSSPPGPLYQTRRPLPSQEPHSTTRPRVALPPLTASVPSQRPTATHPQGPSIQPHSRRESSLIIISADANPQSTPPPKSHVP
jgi:hypothetical protein